MPNNILDIRTVRRWVRSKLGEPIVCVELNDAQIDSSLEDAFLWWASYRGWYLQNSFQIVSGQQAYDLSALLPEVVDITKIWFPLDPNLDVTGAWPGFLDVEGYPYGDDMSGDAQGGFYAGLVQWMQTRKTTAHVLSADRDWFFNEKTKSLIITPGAPMPNYSGTAIYLYETPFKKEYLPQVPTADAYLIRERALAEAAYTLGRIRGKYTGGLPAAQGNVQLDGSDLLREAESKFEILDRKIMELMPPPAVIIG